MSRLLIALMIVASVLGAAHAQTFSIVPDRASGPEEFPKILEAECSPDGHLLALVVTANPRPALVLIDLSRMHATTRPFASYVYDNKVSTYCAHPTFSPDGRLLVYPSGPRRVAVVDAASLRPLRELALPLDGPPHGMAFSPDGRLLAIAQAADIKRNDVTVYEVASGRRACGTRLSALPVTELAFSRDGRLLGMLSDITRSDTGQTMRLFLADAATGRLLGKADTDSNCVSGLAFDRAVPARAVYTANGDGLQQWDVPSLKLAHFTKLPARGSFTTPQVSAYRSLLLTCGFPEGVVFDPVRREVVKKIANAHQGEFSPSGTTVWTLRETFRLDTLTLAPSAKPERPPLRLLRPLEFSPPAFGGRPWMTFRTSASGNVILTLLVTASSTTSTEWIAWTPEGAFVASADAGKRVKARVDGHERALSSLSPRPEGVQRALLDPASQIGAPKSSMADVSLPREEPKLERVKVPPLSEAAQKAQLDGRLELGWKMMEGARLGSFCSFLYAMEHISLSSSIEGIGDVKLANPFPQSYRPTWREVLDSVARQTLTSWRYDSADSTWMLAEPASPTHFTFRLADGWSREDRGLYIFCKPPKARVGMDIYMLGSYSFDGNDTAGMSKIRDAIALEWASPFKAGLDKMKRVTIDGAEALYFESPAPARPETTWRQWVFARGNRMFMIVSALNRGEEAELLPAVQDMVKSFKAEP